MQGSKFKIISTPEVKCKIPLNHCTGKNFPAVKAFTDCRSLPVMNVCTYWYR